VRQAGLIALLAAAIALAAVDRAGADPADQLYPIGLRVEGGEETWRPTYFFRLEWERPPIAAQGLPVAAVGYRVRDAGGALVVRETRLAGERTLADVLIPPVPGAYTAEVWLEGPGGERGPAASAALRYDGAAPGTPLPTAPEGWIAGSAAAEISVQPPPGPPPVSGIRGYAVSVDRGGETWPCASRASCGDAEIDLRAGSGDDTLSLGNLPEGRSTIRVVAVSGAGVPSAEAATAVVRVDATPPGVTLAGVPGGWADGPVRMLASATDALSGMAAGGPNGPFTAIAVDGGVPRAEPGDSASVAVTGEGVHRVEAFARDAAGNIESRRPRTAQVAIDETPPQVAFASLQDPADPECIEATVADPLSGVDPGLGSIAVREAGTFQPWQHLTTRQAGGRLVARWDSGSHPQGVYEFRATAWDAAGNAASTERRANHTRMVLVNPLKKPVRLHAGFGGSPRPGAMEAPYGGRVPYRGLLVSATGVPLGGLPVQVVESFGPGAAVRQRTTTVVTGAGGAFALRLRPGPTRTVAATFAGTRTLGRAGGEEAELAVRAGVRLRASARVARVGGAPVVFAGRVGAQGARVPAEGLPVELQFRIPGGEWAEFRTVPTDARGRFRYAYAFSDDDSRGVQFQFRAQIGGGGWPYEPAASKSVSVTGR
jgi:hypothetical protein